TVWLLVSLVLLPFGRADFWSRARDKVKEEYKKLEEEVKERLRIDKDKEDDTPAPPQPRPPPPAPPPLPPPQLTEAPPPPPTLSTTLPPPPTVPPAKSPTSTPTLAPLTEATTKSAPFIATDPSPQQPASSWTVIIIVLVSTGIVCSIMTLTVRWYRHRTPSVPPFPPPSPPTVENTYTPYNIMEGRGSIVGRGRLF
ncbi:hypothetical protein PMAYCL1PPCAC_20379, partial [Pristionchus mayeri]